MNIWTTRMSSDFFIYIYIYYKIGEYDYLSFELIVEHSSFYSKIYDTITSSSFGLYCCFCILPRIIVRPSLTLGLKLLLSLFIELDALVMCLYEYIPPIYIYIYILCYDCYSPLMSLWVYAVSKLMCSTLMSICVCVASLHHWWIYPFEMFP